MKLSNRVWSSCGISALTLAVPVLSLADERVLEEVVVTAQKREERLIDVPMSITAISGRRVAGAGAELHPGSVVRGARDGDPGGRPRLLHDLHAWPEQSVWKWSAGRPVLWTRPRYRSPELRPEWTCVRSTSTGVEKYSRAPRVLFTGKAHSRPCAIRVHHKGSPYSMLTREGSRLRWLPLMEAQASGLKPEW